MKISGKARAQLYAQLKKQIEYTTYEGREVRKICITHSDGDIQTIYQDICPQTTERRFLNLAIELID